LEAESGKKHKAAAAFVKEEVYLAPWNTTGNFLSVQNGKGQLQLTGFGDPTGTGAGFSYLRVPQKVQAKQKKVCSRVPYMLPCSRLEIH
jgi:transcription initiation factor TFIID subunit 1